MLKFPTTLVWAVLVIVAGLSAAFLTAPARAPIAAKPSRPFQPPRAIVHGSPLDEPAIRAEQDDDVADPIIDLAEHYMALVDLHEHEWDSDGSEGLSWDEFLGGLDSALQLPVELRTMLPDLSGGAAVTRSLARQTVDLLLGVRLIGSQPRRVWPGSGNYALRFSQGRVLNLIHFRQLDTDRSGALDARELANLGLAGLEPPIVLEGCDADGDAHISLAEWWRVPVAGAADTMVEFRAVDADQDGFLDREELRHVPGYKMKVADHVLPGFDSDGDGKLSYEEYRFTPLANPLVDWNREIVDGDGQLTFDEYLDRSEPFVLLFWNFFQRFDLNHNGVLDREEYTFHSPPRKALYSLNADGTGLVKLLEAPGYPDCGSPQISPDGKTVAFDARPALGRGQLGVSTIIAANLDGTDLRRLCHGQMPSWSADGKQFACSRVEGGYGIAIMNVDGEEQRRLGGGWSAQWSPDGKKIAYYDGPKLLVYDVETGQSRDVLGEQHRYQQVFWNMCWSPDSQRICFKGVNRRGADRH